MFLKDAYGMIDVFSTMVRPPAPRRKSCLLSTTQKSAHASASKNHTQEIERKGKLNMTITYEE